MAGSVARAGASGRRTDADGKTIAVRDGTQRSVLFAYIGWSERYQGESVGGTHGYLVAHGDDCSEMFAFEKEGDGFYRCGIGSGSVRDARIDVVFVAKRPGETVRRAVLLYLDAEVEPMNTNNDWWIARTKKAFLLPTKRRVEVPDWPGSTGLRRWARRGGAVEHGHLLQTYERVRSRALSEGPSRVRPVDGEHDEELLAFEGALRRSFIAHRSRERTLRNRKIRDVLGRTRKLACEVPRCGFDFRAAYGDLGAGYAHVHHKEPLSRRAKASATRLEDLAIVCANCHAMIHVGGKCRALAEVGRVRRGSTQSRS